MSSTYGGGGTRAGASRARAGAGAAASIAVAAPGRGAVRTAVVWEALLAVLRARAEATRSTRLDIVDAGGGTGGFAVPLASLGHNVIVVDPSPDSLAAAQRRAAEAGVELHAVQGDVADLPAIAGEGPAGEGAASGGAASEGAAGAAARGGPGYRHPGRAGADLVLCHSVLEYVDDPAGAVATIGRVLRPGGTVSVLAASAVAAAIHRALAGHFGEARRLIEGGAGPDAGLGEAEGQAGAPRRFTLGSLTRLIDQAGMRPGAAHGVRVFSDLVPSSMTDGDPGAGAALLALEEAAAQHAALRDIATQLHIFGHRPGSAAATAADGTG